jgi:hypothetical protein
MRNKYHFFSLWLAGALFAGLSACAVTDDEPIGDGSPASQGEIVVSSQDSEVGAATQVMDPCTALVGCIATANQNENQWLVPKCWEVLGPACAATLEQAD